MLTATDCPSDAARTATRFDVRVPPRLRRVDAAAYLLERYGLQIAVQTLAKYASVGGGPRFQRNGRVPLYPVEELDRWAVERLGKLVSHTGEAA